MSGHSKWANIKHRKAAADSKKSKITTRMVKEITIAAKMGGGDVNSNPRLRLALEKARENNVAKENVERAIKRGMGELEGVNYEEIRFEGYGIGGVGIIVDCLTDNKIRTIAEVRHAFTKYGGNLGTDGCVAYQFKHCGQMLFAPGIDEERLLEIALDNGAEDVINNDDGSVEVLTAANDFLILKDQLERAQFHPEFAEIVMKSLNDSEIHGVEGVKMQKLLDAFDALDDVQEVYTTGVIIDENDK